MSKDYFATTALVRILYELNCLRNPARSLGLGAGEIIHLVPISHTVRAARNVVFGGVMRKIALAPWFKGRYKDTLDYIEFPDKRIRIEAGASTDANALGLNVYSSIVDECVTGDTSILTPSGYFPVSDLYDSSVNDRLTFGPIISYNEKAGKPIVGAGFIRPASVAEVFEVKFDDGRSVKATSEHPFLVRLPCGELDYVFLRDLRLGDEVVVVHDAKQVRKGQQLLREATHDRSEAEDVRGRDKAESGAQEVRGDEAQDQALESANEGAQGRDRRGLVPRLGAGGLGSARARTAQAGGAGDPSASVDARAAGWRRATYEEALAGYRFSGEDADHETLLYTLGGGEGEDWGGEQAAQGEVQTLRGDKTKDQRGVGLAREAWELFLHRVCRDEERYSEEGSRKDGISFSVGEACDANPRRGRSCSQFSLRSFGGNLLLAGEKTPYASRFSSGDGGQFDTCYRGETEGLYLQRQGAGESRGLCELLRGSRLELRSLGRAAAVARVVSIRSKGSHQTFDVMSLPRGNFVAEGIVVHNTNFMGQVKHGDTTVSAAGKTYDRAQMIYDALVRRVKSRYQRSGIKGKIFLVSSKLGTDDFTERRIKEHIKNKTTAGVFVLDYTTWCVKPEAFANQKWYKCSVSSAEGRCRVLGDDEEPPEDALVFEFPYDYLSEFERDPAGSARDIGGVALDAYAPFITKREAIEEMFEPEWPHLFEHREWEMGRPLTIQWSRVMTKDARNEPVPYCCPHATRHVHIDLSKNMCATGFCVAHQAGMMEVVRFDRSTRERSIEEAPVFHVDGLLRILAGPAGDIDHSEVRGLIYKLNEGGFNIQSVSMDHWMSVPNMQLLKKRGYRVEEISTVKKIDPFETVRSALYENRLRAPENDILRTELRSLELDPKRPPTRPRVVVPPNHTKDLADALGGAIYYLASRFKGGVLLSPSLGLSESQDPKKPRWQNGDVIWGDEEGYDDVPMPGDKKSGPGSFVWIM